ncbi:MAG: hypothetical protein HKN45_02155 [Flavobacteriales bacterium]|nr:hypothetical protein [Flavobacteriales bacterium]
MKPVRYTYLLLILGMALCSCYEPDSPTPEEIQGIVEQSCVDNVQSGAEEGVDCGGPCPPCVSCSDGILNQGETFVDCGGPCPPC